ncbi:hypothetical protein [Oryzobacter terrae]|uniref:hypothetical protein n=1 Tax=Oryzobacter terrae TaxID=1620385 RepID=UPI00366F5582
MAKRSIQGFVELASGLGELTRSRAKEAATELLTLTGVEGSSKKVAKQAGKLADDLLVAAESNRKQVVRLVRSEVEAAIGRIDVGRLVGEVQGLGATVAALAAQVDDLARAAAGRPAPSAPARVVDVEPEPARVAPRPAPARKRPAKKASSTSASSAPAATPSPAKKAPARKAAARKSPATKATPKKATTKKAPAKKAPAKKATTTAAKKAPAKKATTTAARKAPAKKAPARKTSAAKKAPAATTTPSTPSTTAGTA